MNTDAVRARNARKRAKLKAHKRSIQVPTTEPVYVFEFAVKGIKNGFPDDARDAEFDAIELPRWALEDDFIEVIVEGPATLYDDLDSVKSEVREFVEMVYGFNEWDSEVLLENVYKQTL